MIGITAAVIISGFWGYQIGKQSRDQRIRDADNLLSIFFVMVSSMKKRGVDMSYIEKDITEYERKYHGKN